MRKVFTAGLLAAIVLLSLPVRADISASITYAQLLSIKQKVSGANMAVLFHDYTQQEGGGPFRIVATVREFTVTLIDDEVAQPATFNTDFPAALAVDNLNFQ